MTKEKNPFLIRHYNPQTDLALLAGLLAEVEAFDKDGEDASEAALQRMLEWPDYHPEQDAWLAEIDGKPCGYALALARPAQRCTIYVAVHPAMRRQGLGKTLLAHVLERATEMDSKNVTVYANGHHQAANEFVTRHGFTLVGCYGTMQAPAGLEPAQFEIPAGFYLKRFSEINHLEILASALNDCYQDMWGHQHIEHSDAEDSTASQFLKEFGAEGIHLLFDTQNTIVGICSATPGVRKDTDGQPADVLDAPGIIKAYRDRGYQLILAREALRWLREQGNRSVILEFWGDDENTLNSYTRIGFEHGQKLNAYNKELK